MRQAFPDHVVRYGFIGILAILSGVIVWTATVRGIGISTDSVNYYWGAESLLTQQAYLRLNPDWSWSPQVTWPPLFSLLIAGVTKIVGDMNIATRMLQIFLLIVFCFGYGIFLSTHHRHPLWKWALILVIFVMSPSVLLVFSYAWSEPTFLVVAFLSYVLLLRYASRENAMVLVGAGLAAGFAFLTKYMGLATILSGGIFLLFRAIPFRRKIHEVLLYGVPAGMCMVLWTIRSRLVSETVFGRMLTFYPPTPKHAGTFLGVFGQWITRDVTTYNGMVDLVQAKLAWGVIVLLCIVFVVRRQAFRSAFGPAHRLSWLFIGSYIVVYVISVTVVDISAELDVRTLAPLYPHAFFLILSLLSRTQDASLRSVWLRNVTTAALFLYAGWSIWQSALWITRSMQTGIGAVRWINSPVVPVLKRIPKDTAIYSTRPKVVYYLSGHTAIKNPLLRDSLSYELNADYPNQYEAMVSDFRSKRAVLVWFPESETEQTNRMSKAELLTDLGVRLEMYTPEIQVYVPW